jgi:hypothetical protein
MPAKTNSPTDPWIIDVLPMPKSRMGFRMDARRGMEETEAEEADLDSSEWGNEFKATPRRRCVSWTTTLTTLTTWTLGPRNTTDDDRVVRYDPEGPRRARMAMTVWSFVPQILPLLCTVCEYAAKRWRRRRVCM